MNNRRFYLLFLTLYSTTVTYAISAHDIYVTTFSILSYARWNSANPSPILCVINNTEIANQFKNISQQYKYNYQIQSISVEEFANKACEAVFFSTLTPQQEFNILNSQGPVATLSFSSNNIACEMGSSFCLYKKNQLTSFKVNLSSLSQSNIHVDPRVLMLAKQSEQ